MSQDRSARLTAERAELLRRRLEGQGADGDGRRPGEVPLERRAAGERAVPSFGQRRLWFLELLQPGHIGYNMPDVSYRLRGPLDVAALVGAWRHVVGRHEVLRSRFVVSGGEPSVEVASVDGFQVDVADVSQAADPFDEACRLARVEAETPFDLGTGPLCRARLVRLGVDDHVLLVTFHHSVFDGWSIGVFQGELAAAYEALAAGREPGLPELAVQYSDFAAWQREWLAGDRMENQLAFWRRHLDGAELILELPADRPRPPVPSYRGGLVEFAVPEGVADRLRELGRGRGASLFMVTLAAYQALLGRYAGTSDVVTGCPTAGRSRPELERLVGFFVNSLPLRTDLSGDPSFAEVVDRVRGTVLDAFDHQDLPFERLVEDLDPARDLSRNPVIQVWFDLFSPDDHLRLPGLDVAPFEAPSVTTRFDVELHLVGGDDGALTGQLVYAADLFEAATMRRFAEHYVNLLEAVAAAPDERLSNVQVAGPDELRQVLTDWNDTATPFRDDRTIPGLFEEQVARTPNAVAVVCGEESWSFARLNAEAGRVAAYLRGLGAGPGSVVGIYLPRGLDMVVAVLGVLKAGAGYLPLDLEHPAERTAFMLDDAGARLVLTHEGLADRLPDEVTLVRLDADAEAIAACPSEATASADVDDLCYVIYTSGSTGRPKGVAMTHRPLLNLLAWQMGRQIADGPTLQFSSLTFDISFQEMFSSWLCGQKVVLLSQEQRRDPEQMLAVMRAGGVRRLHCPPLVLEQLAQVADADLPPLAEIVTAGDRLLFNDQIRRFLSRLPGVSVDNQYGPTEAHVITGWQMTGDMAGWPTAPPVGVPIANTRVYVLDEGLRPVPIGVPGEVCVAGACLAWGYLGRPDLTADRFVPDPFGAEPGGRLYRTGDVARWNADGQLEFLGRVDHQVKVRGYRIEPGEIEAALVTHPLVAEAVVTAFQAPDGDRRLAAYLVPAGEDAPDTDDLRAHLKLSLPDYMVPGAFVVLPELPLSGTGKLDRKALPDPLENTATGDDTPPRNRQEEVIAEVWAQALGLSRVGVHRDFFELGGHSLLATQVMSRIRAAFGVRLPLRAIFEHRTVGELAEAVEAALLAEIEAMSDDEVAVAIGADRPRSPSEGTP